MRGGGQRRRERIRIWVEREEEEEGIPGTVGHDRIFGFSVCFRKGMACLKMATGVTQAVLSI